jgi:protein involved in polysaccharide export with SLBB domain
MFRLASAILIALFTIQTAAASDLGLTQALYPSGTPSSSLGSPYAGTATAPVAAQQAVPGSYVQYPQQQGVPATGFPPGTDPAMGNMAPSFTQTGIASVKPNRPNGFDYSINTNSDVFGAQLFSGAFAREGATQFNPDYLVAIGDKLHVRMWGAFNLDAMFVVDPKGNIFLPHVGPVSVIGVRNKDLQTVIDGATKRVFKANVLSYASLAAAQPVRIFVSGFVYRPGLYSGTSMDSLLHYLDQAGGIDVERGSFLDIQVKRNGQIRARANLYDFLLDGRIPQIQLTDGDVIFVTPRKSTARVTGLAENAKRFEFAEQKYSIGDIARMAKPLAVATHVRITRNTGSIRNTEYFHLGEADRIAVSNGDEIEFTADKKPGTISVRVEGEHQSPQEYVLPYGSKMRDLVSQIHFNERSDTGSIQLFRLSVKERQAMMLQTSLKRLESAALTARSATGEEALLRKQEAELLLQWVDRARNIEPTGQVYIAESKARDELLLENGDVVRVPAKDGLVLVSGEVLFPNAIAYDSDFKPDDYIRRTGGYTQNADVSRVIVAHRDGSFDDMQNSDTAIRAGDQILVLPKIDTKSRQFFKDMTQIIYQIAVSAKVIFGW